MRKSPHSALALATTLLTQLAQAQGTPPAQPVPPPPTAAPGEATPAEAQPPAAPTETAPSDATAADTPVSEPPAEPTAPPPAVGPSPIGTDTMGEESELGATPSAPAGPAVAAKESAEDTDGFFAEDWWAHTRPAVELHGNFRVRTELYHQFSLGRVDPPGTAYWPRPLDDGYTDLAGEVRGAAACTPLESGSTTSTSNSPGDANQLCHNPTQAGGNMRFRIEPAIIISDNLRIRSQIDLFDNLVLGSTAQGNSNFPSATGYEVAARGGYYPVSAASWSQGPPISGINTVQDGIAVKRAWGEYETPVGQARFGRMPDHWGLGLEHNAGDDIDGDYQSTVDRIAFFTGLESLSLYAGGAWDFPYEGPTSAAFTAPGGQPYDLAQYDDVSAMNLMLFRKVNPQLERRILSRGGVVVNGGLYLTFAFQRIANDYGGTGATCDNGAAANDCQAGQADTGFTRRGFEQWTPDIYGEVKYKKFYAGFELVTHQGRFDSTQTAPGDNDYENTTGGSDGWKINQWGFALKLQQKLIEDKLKLSFDVGWASGDNDVEGLVPPAGSPETQIGDRSFETFRFHPGYRVDLILNRNILTRVQGSYFFKPAAQYDFIRKATGMRLGGRAEVIWTRASQFMQAPGHEHDLGIELNGSIVYQSKDGALNDSPDLQGGFYGMLQYGVLFPLPGLGYQDAQNFGATSSYPGLQTAQMVRMFLGIAY
jgi:uncharacterized protein (TIGR04551 family)